MQPVQRRLLLKRVKACLLHESAAYWPFRLTTNKYGQQIERMMGTQT